MKTISCDNCCCRGVCSVRWKVLVESNDLIAMVSKTPDHYAEIVGTIRSVLANCCSLYRESDK